MIKKILFLLSFVAMAAIWQNCSDDKDTKIINVALTTEPRSLNPVFGAGDVSSRQVFSNHIFPVLVDYSDDGAQRVPILAKNVPDIKEITEGAYKGGVSYTYEILDEAVWDNGTPVTANDYVFTIKAFMHPKIDNLFKTYYEDIKEIQIDAANPKKFTVILGKPYILAEDALSSVLIMPEYHYDANGVMKSFPIGDFYDATKVAAIAANPAADAFANDFTSKFSRENIVGCGAYKFDNWETGSRITISKKPNHWTQKFNGQRAGLTAEPEKIEYKIYANHAAAINDLKAKQIDLMALVPASDFEKLKADATFANDFQFLTPNTAITTALSINTQRAALQDVKVRKALTHLINIQDLIKNFYAGMAQPIKNPIPLQREYYASESPEIDYNIDEAKKLITEAGWADTNNNGTVDKKIGGKLTELNLTYIVVNKSPGPEIAQIIQNAAKQVGVGITIDAKDAKLAKETSKKGEFDLYYTATSGDIGLDDFNQKWGSKSTDNITGFGSTASDALIEKINATIDKTQRNAMYHEFQKMISDNCPIIPLVNPKDRIIVSKRLSNAKTVAARPFFREHTFK